MKLINSLTLGFCNKQLPLQLNYFDLQTFSDLGLREEIVKALSENGITTPTPIQEKTIPTLLEQSADFLGLAQTGTGKTAAFGLPLIEAMDVDQPHVQAIVLAPTRELAQQIAQQFKLFSKYLKRIEVGIVYGGAPIQGQISDLKKKKPQIVVATPGRMIDLIKRKSLNLSNVRHVILDEADEMLNMGFKEEIDTILSFTQHDKNTWLFSATMPKEIKNLADKYMTDPVEVRVSKEERVNTNITHKYIVVKRNDKQAALERLIDQEAGDLYGIVFCRTKAETQRLAMSLVEKGYPVEALHGDMTQAQRNQVMRKFKSGKTRLITATDVAARGIDVDNLTHVMHFDLPDDFAFYTHRSGRTGRAGKKGVAMVIITPGEHRKIGQLERQLGISFALEKVPTNEEVQAKAMEGKLEELINIEASDDARLWAQAIADQLTDISKEELLAKMLTLSTQSQQSSDADLNADVQKGKKGPKDRSDRPSKGRRSDQGGEEGMDSFHINLGKKDQLRTGDLLKIICDTTGVRSKHIGRINLQNDGAYFDVKTDRSAGVPDAFKGLRFKGRPIKVSKK
jgi:ATP-dependent RNA helicase DeaD